MSFYLFSIRVPFSSYNNFDKKKFILTSNFFSSVDGGLSPWTEFESCDKTCGDGVETRTRTCTHPAPAHGGKNCVGRTHESRSCKVKECPGDLNEIF